MAESESLSKSVWLSLPTQPKLRWRFGVLSLAAVIVLAILGWWVGSIVEKQARTLLANELEAVMRAHVMALRIWVDSQESSAQAAADDLQAKDLVLELVRLAHEPDAASQAAALTQLRLELAPILQALGFEDFVVLDSHGHLVAAQRNELVGSEEFPLQDDLLETLFERRSTMVTRPFKSVIPLPVEFARPRTGVPTMFVFAPVLNGRGDAIAALGLRIDPQVEFARIMTAARTGDSGETYLFDANGMLMSESRFDTQLKRIGLLSDDEETLSILNLEVRDPAVNLVAGEVATLPPAERPLTRMAQDAIAGNSGVDVDGYRDYRGVPVVGAWTWVDDYGVGIATEIDYAEADRPLRLLRNVFRGLFTLFGVSAIAILAFSLITGHLQQQSQSDARQFAVLLAGERAQALSEIRSRSEFLAKLGSDIRAPLHSVLQMTDLTMETELSLQQRNYLTNVLTSARELEELLNDILDMNQVETGHVEMKDEVFLFRDMLNEIIGPVTIEARSKGKSLSCDVQPDVPDGLFGDVERVRQVIKSIAVRAVKLAGPDGIAINVSAGERAQDRVEVQFRITVRGNARAGQTFRSILKDFRNSASMSGKRTRGDLAVAVAARLLEFSGGRIWIEDADTADSRICFANRFEIREVDEQSAHRTELGLIPGLPVLVVDRDESSRQSIEQILQRSEMVPTSLSNGDDLMTALDSAREEGSPFGLVIIDAEGLGAQDGFVLCRKIKQSQMHAATPVILVVNAEQPDQIDSAADAGATAHLLKPVKATLLEGAIVSAVLGRGRYQQLRKDLGAAEMYVRSLIPPPTDEPLRIDWRYVPATELAGDALGFHWIDDDHCAFYVIDASGHGIDACLRSVSILDAIKSQSLPETDFRRPDQVLTQLNRRFPMERHDNQCFTMWYGVYNRVDSTLAWSGGGHPPGMLLHRENGSVETIQLPSTGPMIGMLPDSEFTSGTQTVHSGCQLYVYSDGVFEIEKPDGVLWTIEEFALYLRDVSSQDTRLDMMWQHVHALHGEQALDDDFTMLEVTF